jgi:MFS family permease
MLFMQEVNAQRLRHAAGKILADLLYAQNSAKIGGTFHEAGGYMRAADAFVVNVAIPSISRGLRTSLSEVELVIASYILVYAVLLVTGGRLGDRFGHKRMFLLGVAGFSLASIGCALAPSVLWLIGARVLQGASAALLYPQALSILQVTFSGRERAAALGIYGSALPVAAVMGQVGGGLLLQAGLVFVPSAIGTFVAALLGPRLIPKLGLSILILGCFARGFGLLVMLVIVLYSGTKLSGLTLTPDFFIMGAGSGLGVAPLVGTITSRVRSQDAGTASGVVSTIMQVSNVLGVAVVGLIFFSILNVQPMSESQPMRYVLALSWTLPFLGALAFISGSLVGLLPRTKIRKR